MSLVAGKCQDGLSRKRPFPDRPRGRERKNDFLKNAAVWLRFQFFHVQQIAADKEKPRHDERGKDKAQYVIVHCAQNQMKYDNEEYEQSFYGIDAVVTCYVHFTWFFFNLFRCTFSMSSISSFL